MGCLTTVPLLGKDMVLLYCWCRYWYADTTLSVQCDEVLSITWKLPAISITYGTFPFKKKI